MPWPKKYEDTLMVLTMHSFRTMVAHHGCGHWKLDKNRAGRMRYLVATCNEAPGAEPDVPHGAAFMLATIDSLEPAKDDRWLVKLRQYARLNRPETWPKGNQNPVMYTSLTELGIDPEGVRWLDFPQIEDMEVPSTRAPVKLTFDEAKAGLAASLGVKPDQIEITVRA